MERKIKLIWDFRGPAAYKTAEHHCIHLKEFAEIETLDYHDINFTQLTDMHSIAFVTVNESDMRTYRALKPHRGELG